MFGKINSFGYWKQVDHNTHSVNVHIHDYWLSLQVTVCSEDEYLLIVHTNKVDFQSSCNEDNIPPHCVVGDSTDCHVQVTLHYQQQAGTWEEGGREGGREGEREGGREGGRVKE